MITNGATIKTRVFGKLTIGEMIASGGQGTAYDAVAIDGSQYILKLYHPEFQTAESRKRLETLIAQKFETENEALITPREIINVNESIGHVTPKAPGLSLEEMLTTGGFDMLEGIQIACALARSISVLHQRGYAHGDIHANNVLVHRNRICRISVIDFDNFAGNSLPASPCLGHQLYMAPEIRVNHTPPSVEADRFSLAVLTHELLTLRHPVPNDATEAEFNEVMSAGKWLGDPGRSTKRECQQGYPPEVLDTDLSRLFRLGISHKPAERPTAEEWQDALFNSLFRVFVCPSCSAPNLVDNSKKRCVVCRIPYPVLKLSGVFGRIILDQSSTVISRNVLGGSASVSKRHAVIRRVGPEYRIEDCSANGVYRKTADSWIRLPQSSVLSRQPILSAGETIRFADVECLVASV